MRKLDKLVIEETGLPGIVLMENAARSVVNAIQERWPKKNRPIVVVCGTGNNGGDGFACARLLASADYPVRVWLTGAEEKLQGDAKTNYDVLKDLCIHPKFLNEEPDQETGLTEDLQQAELIIDAICGTGFAGTLHGPAQQAVSAINRSGKPVVAIDVPSGLNGDATEIPGDTVKATMTVTLGFPKPALLIYPAAAQAGELIVGDLGFPEALARRLKPDLFQTSERLLSLLPERTFVSHKNTNGRVLIIAGSPGMAGAAIHACRGALAAGAGFIHLATPRSIMPFFAAAIPEVVVHGLPESQHGLAEGSSDRMLEIAEDCDTVLIGPGLGRKADTVRSICEFTRYWHGPLVADADALFAMAENPKTIDSRTGELILTPHYGEMAHFFRTNVIPIQNDPIKATCDFARNTRACTLLKGPRVIIGLASGEAVINTTGTPALAAAGTGDLLAGLITTLRARSINQVEAAMLGAYLHGMAGRHAAAASNQSIVTVNDVTRSLFEVMGKVYQDRN